MRTEDIEQFDEELWNIVKPGMPGPPNLNHTREFLSEDFGHIIPL